MHEIYTENNSETQDITWKTHNSGKNHDSPQAVEYTIWEEYNVEEKHRGNDPLSSSSPHARRRYKMEATTSLSLSIYLSLLHALYNFLYNNIHVAYIPKSVCPKSYLYLYDFRAIYIDVHSNRSDRSGPVRSSAGSLRLPSGGTCFLTRLCLSQIILLT